MVLSETVPLTSFGSDPRDADVYLRRSRELQASAVSRLALEGRRVSTFASASETLGSDGNLAPSRGYFPLAERGGVECFSSKT